MHKRDIGKSLTVLTFLCLSFLLPLMAISNEPYEGRIQILTERFQIIFEPQDAWAAQKIASFSDRVYENLTTLLEHAPQKRIPVILVSRNATANGSYSPFPPKITLYITSPAQRFLGSRTTNWLESLFVHELTHYIHLTSAVGIAKILTPIFGPDVPAMNSLLMPGWWVEGITTYAESTQAEGGRGDAPLFALTYQAPLAEGAMWSIAQGAYNSAYPPSGRIYSTGYLMVNHLSKTYGESIFAEINRNFATWPLFGMTSALKRSIGKSSKEVFIDALSEIKETLPKQATVAPLFSPNTVGDFYLPYPTAQGLLGFARTLDGGGSIINYSQPESKITVNIPIYNPESISLTQDGTTAYISYYWEDPIHAASTSLVAVSYADIYRYHLNTHTYEPITRHCRLLHPSVNPDGSRLIAIEPVEDRYRLVEINLASGKITPLYENLKGSVYEPQFSMDGKTIVFIEIVEGNSTLIVLSEQGEIEPLWPHNSGEIHNPRFIDQQTIWFSSDIQGTLALYSIDVSTGTIDNLYNDSLGLLGAIRSENSVVYGTYTANGYALREISVSALKANPVHFPKSDVTSHTIEITQQYLSSPYVDTPRFNLWLPFLLNMEDEIAPGATVLMRSPLGRHTVSFSAGWSVKYAIPRGDFSYQFDPGPFSIFVQGAFSTSQKILAAFTLPLWYSNTPSNGQRLSLLTNLSTTIKDSVALNAEAQLGYTYWSHYGPKDYFGAKKFSIGTALVGQQEFQPNNTSLFPIFFISGQFPLGKTHQALQLEVQAASVTSLGTSIEGLYPDNLLLQERAGEVKALFSLRYHIPLGAFDQPIPYGGLTGMGLSLHAQTAGYIISGQVAWERDLYVGALLTADITIGAGIPLQPYFGISASVATGETGFTLGINLDSLFSNHKLESRLE